MISCHDHHCFSKTVIGWSFRVCLGAEELEQWYANRRDFLANLSTHTTRASRSPRFRPCSPEIRKKSRLFCRLNLPVRGSHQQLIARLKSALKSQATRTGRAMAVRPGRSTCRKGTNTAATSAQPTALNSEHDSVSEGNSLSMEDGSPSLDDLLSLPDCPALPPAVGSVPSPVDTPFSDSQLHVLQQTVQTAVQNARFQQDNTNEHHYSSPPVRPTGMALPLGLQWLWTSLWRKNPEGWVCCGLIFCFGLIFF